MSSKRKRDEGTSRHPEKKKRNMKHKANLRQEEKYPRQKVKIY